MSSDESYSWVWEEEELPPRDYTSSRPPTTLGAIVNRKGKFDKYVVVDNHHGWRSMKIARIDDKENTRIIGWTEFEQDYEERFF